MADTAKIGIVASEFFPAVGGMEQHALGLSRALAEHYDVTVYTTTEHAGVSYDEKFVARTVLTLAVDRDASTLADAGMDFWLVLNAGYAPLANMLEQPVFVYCHGNDFLTPWITQRRTMPVKIAGILSAVPPLRRYGAHVQWRSSRTDLERGLKAAACVYVNSRYTREALARIFPHSTLSIEINPPAVANHFFSEHGDGGRQPRHPVSDASGLRLLTVARLSSSAPQKNVDNVIRAVGQIAGAHDVSLRIAGDGNLRHEFEELARELGIAAQVEFIGNVSGSRVKNLLGESDLFVLPSKETFGLAYVEAAACGVPSIASSMGATDALQDGITGFVIDGASPDRIAKAITDFIENPCRFDCAAMKIFAKTFTWSNVALKLVESMEHVLATRAQSGVD